MNDLTIPARLVAEGVGLPPVWRYWLTGMDVNWRGWSVDPRPDAIVDLSNSQTAFGCALRLDAWERARNRYWDLDDYLWERRWRDPEALVARLRVIGEDAMIRRALGWEVEAGTLATLAWHGGLRCWMMKHPSIPTHDHAWPFIVERILSTGADTPVPALAGITDPDEARTAIWQEVCDVG